MRISPAAFAALLAVSPACATAWNVDHAHSKLGFVVQWSGQPFTATFKTWNAKIDFDPANLAASKADVTIDMTSAVSGEDELDQNLPGAQGFDAAKFPTARFVTKNFRGTGKDRYEAVGDLTIRGTTRPVTLPFSLTMQGDTAHMKGEATIARTDFGVGSGSAWEGETPVAHAVKVTVDLTATKAH
jgi:polyisoprenoid-binding protein YceI